MISGTLLFVLPPLNNLPYLTLTLGDMFGHTDLAHPLPQPLFKRDYNFPSLFRMDTVMVNSNFAQLMILSLDDIKGLRLIYPDVFIQIVG